VERSEEWKTEYGGKGVRIVEKMTTIMKWLTNTTNLIKRDEVEEVYREWIKTYNGGIKKIRKIMKRKRRKNKKKGKNTGKNTKNWKKE
jgi:hypothetical protein